MTTGVSSGRDDGPAVAHPHPGQRPRSHAESFQGLQLEGVTGNTHNSLVQTQD